MWVGREVREVGWRGVKRVGGGVTAAVLAVQCRQDSTHSPRPLTPGTLEQVAIVVLLAVCAQSPCAHLW